MSDTESKTNPADPFGLAPLWDALMEIYDVFTDLAERHGWRWYLVGGNALGAVRHNGDFIPWDDDLDLEMPRRDYQALQSVANRELPPYLRWVDYQNTASYPYLFGKIMDIRPDVHARLQRQTGQKLPQGLYIDIIPLDGFPSNFWQKAKRWIQRQSLRLVMEYREADPPIPWHRSLRHPLPFLFAHAFPRVKTSKDFLRVMDAHAKALAVDQSHKVAIPIHRWYEQWDVVPRQFMREPTWMMFHGRNVPLPTDVHAYLAATLGKDYMTPPPPEKRCPSHGDFFEAPWKYGPDSVAQPRLAEKSAKSSIHAQEKTI